MISVVANLAWLVPGEVGGSEEYTTRLLAAVARADPDDVDLRLLGHPRLVDAHPGLAPLAFEPLPGPLHRRAHRLAVESTVVAARTRHADVVHHFGGRIPARHHGRDVVTIHDLQPIEQPGNFSPLKAAYLRWALPRSARGARLVCAPSQWVAESIVEHLGIGPDRVRVVSSCWDPDVEIADVDGVLPRLGDGPVLAYPAMTHPHKNHEVLLAAVDRLVERHLDLTLVLTGGPGRAEAEVSAGVARSRARVVRTGRVAASTVRAVIDRADALVFPSRYEGFGLPVVEAMRVATPVVAAESTALPGVVGDAGLLVDPDSVDDWVDALDAVLTDTSLRDRLVSAGALRAEAHAPGPAAERLLSVWREVV